MWCANNISCDYVTIPKPTWSGQVKPCTGRSHFNSVFLERKRFSLSTCARFTVTQSRVHSAHSKHCANPRDSPLVPVFLTGHTQSIQDLRKCDPRNVRAFLTCSICETQLHSVDTAESPRTPQAQEIHQYCRAELSIRTGTGESVCQD